MNERVKRGEKDFPEKVYRFSPDVKVLYYKGNLSLADQLCIGIVGSRKCTAYGRTVAGTIGEKSAENQIIVVSGLAAGIDTEGHRGVLAAGGKTIAVLGGGTECYYPAANRELQKKIGREGLLLSEHPDGYQARAYDFPMRNRIISALSESLVVVEAPNRSGALITAEAAVEQGKNVYAVPGNITSFYSFGTNKLIRDGAVPLILIDDLFTDLGINPYSNESRFLNLGADERKVLSVIQTGGEVSMEDILHQIDMRPSEISGIITILEMKGIIFSSMGKFFVANF